ERRARRHPGLAGHRHRPRTGAAVGGAARAPWRRDLRRPGGVRDPALPRRVRLRPRAHPRAAGAHGAHRGRGGGAHLRAAGADARGRRPDRRHHRHHPRKPPDGRARLRVAGAGVGVGAVAQLASHGAGPPGRPGRRADPRAAPADEHARPGPGRARGRRRKVHPGRARAHALRHGAAGPEDGGGHRHRPGNAHLAQRHPGPLAGNSLRRFRRQPVGHGARRRRDDPGRAHRARGPGADGSGPRGLPPARLPDPRVGAGAGAAGAPSRGHAGRVAAGAARQHRPSRRVGPRPRPRRRGGGAVPHRVPGGGPRHRARRGGAVPRLPAGGRVVPRPAGDHPHLRPGGRQVPGVPAHGARGEPVPGVARHPRVPGRARGVPHAAARAGAGHGARRGTGDAAAGQRDQRGDAHPRAHRPVHRGAAGRGAPGTRRLHAGRHGRNARRGAAGAGAGEARGLLFHRHQRPGAVHAGRGPGQLADRQPLQPVPSRGGAAAGLHLPLRQGSRDRGGRVRRGGGHAAGRLSADRHGGVVAFRGPSRAGGDQEGDPLGDVRGRRRRRGRGAEGIVARRGAAGADGAAGPGAGPQQVLGVAGLVAPGM
ncbi:MAG: Phosphoenolpyruvate-protein phosphotransferase of PTS system, partial [uncultured Gemmatimonadetes bacterium]